MKKSIKILSLTALLLCMFAFASCDSEEPSSGGTPVAESNSEEASSEATPVDESDSAKFKLSDELYNKELFTVAEDGVEFKLGMTISELEAQGIEVPDKEVYETEELLVFFDNEEKINDILAFDELDMSGDFHFGLNRAGVLALFNIDEDNEYIGNDPDRIFIYLLDKGGNQYERVIATEEVKEVIPKLDGVELLILDIEFYEGSTIFCFNLYYPELA